MFTHKVEVKLSFVETKEKNKKGKPIKKPVVHRTLYLTGEDPVLNVHHWKVVARNRKFPIMENGEHVLDEDGEKLYGTELKFTTSYLPRRRSAWWEPYVEGTKWVREKEPNGKVTPAYDIATIMEWLRHKVADPAAVVTELLTAGAVKADSEDELEEAA